MAKVFDLVHKVTETAEPSGSRIPFDDEPGEQAPPPKKRPRVEIIFFYILLFTIFFVMGMVFLSPTLFTRGNQAVALKTSPSPSGPAAGFTIDKEGQSVEEAAKEIGVPTSPSPTPSPAQSTSATPAAVPTTPNTEVPKSTAADIQILNGTTREGAAAAMRTKLAQKGIVVSSIGNYKKRNVARTTVYFTADYKTAAWQVLAVTGGVMIEAQSSTTGGHDILVVIGLRS